jgi:3-hydroxybutyryl-CoA dehydrogenase
MELEQIRRIGVLGGGVMGGGIAQVLAVGGYQVVVRDLTPQILDDTRAEICDRKWGVKRSVEKGKLGFDQALAAMNAVSYTTDLADLENCDLIIEAIPEKLELKQSVFRELDEVIKPDAILTTNTSGFVVAEVLKDVSERRKPLCAGMHFSNPVPVMRMCEVIHTPETSQSTIDALVGVAEKAGRAVSLVKDMPGTYGFILNRVFAAAAREARQIVKDGIATPEDVDKAMITGRNWPAGFFGHRGGIGKQW